MASLPTWGQNGVAGSGADRSPLGGAAPSLEACFCPDLGTALLCGLRQVHGPLWASVSSSVTQGGEPCSADSDQAHVPSGSESMSSSGGVCAYRGRGKAREADKPQHPKDPQHKL